MKRGPVGAAVAVAMALGYAFLIVAIAPSSVVATRALLISAVGLLSLLAAGAVVVFASRRLGQSALTFAGVASISALLATSPVDIAAPIPESPVGWVGGIMAFLLGCFVLICLHELGHALVGVAQGFEPLYFAAGPLLIDLTGDRPRLTISPFHGHVGGAAVLMPPNVPAADLLPRWRRVTLAGPATDLLVGLSLLGLAMSGALAGTPASLFVWLFGGLALLSAVMNALPIQVGGARTDGATYAIVRRGGPDAERFVRASRFGRLVLSPQRPAEWLAMAGADAEQVVAAWDLRSPTDRPLDVELTATMLLYYRHTHTGNHARVRALLDPIADAPRTEGQTRHGLLAGPDTVLAAHLALRDGDAPRARALLERVPPRAFVRANSLWHGAWAALHLAEGHREEAAREVRQAIKLLRRMGLRCGADRTEDAWLQEILARAAQAVVPAPVPAVAPGGPALVPSTAE